MDYKLIAHLLDPSAAHQMEALGGENSELYLKTKFDFGYITNEQKPFSDRVKMLLTMYSISETFATIEQFDSTEDYIIDQDGDGVYLWAKC